MSHAFAMISSGAAYWQIARNQENEIDETEKVSGKN